MGAIAKWGENHQLTSYLCTSDKDLCQMVNDHIFILNTHKENQILGAAEVAQNFGVNPAQIIDYLAIVGDASDNIPGLTGFGPKTAADLLQKFGTLDNIRVIQINLQKKQETVVTEKDKVLLSRKLVVINTDVPIPNELEFLST